MRTKIATCVSNVIRFVPQLNYFDNELSTSPQPNPISTFGKCVLMIANLYQSIYYISLNTLQF